MKTNEALFQAALGLIPGGVNSPVRSFQKVGGTPFFVRNAIGPFLVDVEGNRYIDFVLAYGPMILGHTHPSVERAIRAQAARGLSFGCPHPDEVTFAAALQGAIPSLERVRLVSSGTEAVMTAIRLARAYTGREFVLKLDGGYHGHSDALLVKAGSGGATLGVPDSRGVPEALASLTLTTSYNDTRALSEAFKAYGERTACMIVEPVACNMGVVPPEPGFLETARELCTQYGALLAFDEVITGFRYHYGGYQDLVQINPDLTTLGKIIGGGLPLACVGGRADIMETLAPTGNVYQAGTLSGNPLAVSAGIATLQALKERHETLYPSLEAKAQTIARAYETAAKEKGIPLALNRVGSTFTPFFAERPPKNFAEVLDADTKRYARFFRLAVEHGLFPPPSPFEAHFLSVAHTDALLEEAQERLSAAFQAL
jgi:glutamate-1-semialdehyde 2,1-aminomutase